MNEEYMRLALNLAKKACKQKEVPVGAVVVCEGKVVGTGFNQREKKQNALLHAEIIAINKACKKLKSWRLDNCEIYITLEPCAMCTGAILNSRIKTVYYGAKEEKNGCLGGAVDLKDVKSFNHKIEAVGGILENECRELLQNFFKQLRKNA